MSGARANLFLNRRAACFELVTICLIIVSSLRYHPRATSVLQLRGTRSSSSPLRLRTPIEEIDDAVSSLLPAVRRLPPYDYATVERHNTMIEILRHRHRLDFVLIIPWPRCHPSLGSAGPTLHRLPKHGDCIARNYLYVRGDGFQLQGLQKSLHQLRTHDAQRGKPCAGFEVLS